MERLPRESSPWSIRESVRCLWLVRIFEQQRMRLNTDVWSEGVLRHQQIFFSSPGEERSPCIRTAQSYSQTILAYHLTVCCSSSLRRFVFSTGNKIQKSNLYTIFSLKPKPIKWRKKLERLRDFIIRVVVHTSSIPGWFGCLELTVLPEVGWKGLEHEKCLLIGLMLLRLTLLEIELGGTGTLLSVHL